jgi:hypothetical protein
MNFQEGAAQLGGKRAGRRLQAALDQIPAVLCSTDGSLRFPSWPDAGLSAFQVDLARPSIEGIS